MANALGDRLTHVHLADGSGSYKDEHLVPGRGTQPCAELRESRAAQDFSGSIVVEVGTAFFAVENLVVVGVGVVRVGAGIPRADEHARIGLLVVAEPVGVGIRERRIATVDDEDFA